jgi:uncharacterized protein DUF2802
MIFTASMMLGIAGAALGFAGLTAAVSARRAVRGWQTRCLSLESSFAALRRDMELTASAAEQAGRRAELAEQECSNLADRIELIELRGATQGGAQSFDQAIDSARRGADAGKLAQQFGLSRGEAELVSRLHGRAGRFTAG